MDKFEELRKWAKEYIQQENRVLKAQYDFLDKIKQNRANQVETTNNNSLDGIVTKSLNEFLYT